MPWSFHQHGYPLQRHARRTIGLDFDETLFWTNKSWLDVFNERTGYGARWEDIHGWDFDIVVHHDNLLEDVNDARLDGRQAQVLPQGAVGFDVDTCQHRRSQVEGDAVRFSVAQRHLESLAGIHGYLPCRVATAIRVERRLAQAEQ